MRIQMEIGVQIGIQNRMHSGRWIKMDRGGCIYMERDGRDFLKSNLANQTKTKHQKPN